MCAKWGKEGEFATGLGSCSQFLMTGVFGLVRKLLSGARDRKVLWLSGSVCPEARLRAASSLHHKQLPKRISPLLIFLRKDRSDLKLCRGRPTG